MCKTAVIYWSRTGNTEAMAKAIAQGLQSGGIQATLLNVREADASMAEVYDSFAFGCPAMGKEVLEEKEFEPFFALIETKLKGKKVALFGSYGWGDGKWMRDWHRRVIASGAILLEQGLILQAENPIALKVKRLFGKGKGLDKAACSAFGRRIASTLSSSVPLSPLLDKDIART